MQGCSHILTEEDCQRLKYGKPGMCVDLVLKERSGLATGEWSGRVLDLQQVNFMLSPLFFKSIESKVKFEIEEVYSPYGLHYKYDSTISQIAAYLEDYKSEVFSGERKPSSILKKMAEAVLEKAKTGSAAIKWILLDEPPAGCRSLPQFLLDILEAEYRTAANLHI